jgi:hypothetical protein
VSHSRTPAADRLSALLEAAARWLLRAPPFVATGDSVPVVSVVGLAPRCGTTVVARGLAAELAARTGSAVVGQDGARGASLPRSRQASLLARDLPAAAVEWTAGAGRLCVAGIRDHVALADACAGRVALVLDLGHAVPAGGAVAVSDHVVLVAARHVEPALAEVIAGSLGRIGPRPRVAVNRVASAERFGANAEPLPESPLGARRALCGWRAGGRLGERLAETAGLVLGV